MDRSRTMYAACRTLNPRRCSARQLPFEFVLERFKDLHRPTRAGQDCTYPVAARAGFRNHDSRYFSNM